MTNQFIYIYLIKTVIIAGIFVLYYWLVLRDKKFHYYNRFYLLGALTLSITIPLLKFQWFRIDEPVIAGTPITFNLIKATSVRASAVYYDWQDWALVGVMAITFVLLIVLAFNIIHIYRLKQKGQITRMDGFDFIKVENEHAPFSFLDNLFWKKTIPLNDDNGQRIFKHEITHIHQKHTWDRLYCQIVSSILWVNPFCWLIQKELQTIHEFIADEEAVGNNDVASFAQMLLQTHYGHHFLNPSHSFFYSSIKRRLIMLTKSTNTKYSYLRKVMVLPILIATVCLVSIKLNASEKIEKTAKEIQKTIDLLVSDTSKPGNKKMVKSPPVAKPNYYINGDKINEGAAPPPPLTNPSYYLDDIKISEKEMKAISIDEIASINVLNGEQALKKYPEDGKNGVMLITRKKDNKVILTSKLTSNSSVDTIIFNYDSNKEIVTASYDSSTKDKIFVSNVTWTTKDKQKVIDALEKRANVVIEKKTEGITEKYIIVDNQVGKSAFKPAFYLDGVKITEMEMKAISPNDIESVNVLKGEQAIKKYHEDGKNGVVSITTKKAVK